MRMTQFTDYALRLLMLVAARHPELITIDTAARHYGVSKNHLMKVSQHLVQAGFLASQRGRGGGLRLARPVGDINVGALVRSSEASSILVECFDPQTNACVISSACRLRGVLGEALDAYMAVLDGYTLEDLVRPNSKLMQMLQTA
jgi:Rrf2 family nitric oxide-sensitive transcriptional repressor